MKRCPVCDSPCGDDDMFCEQDGTRLDITSADRLRVAKSIGEATTQDATEAARNAAASITPGENAPLDITRCSSCGGTDAEDGYCRRCGLRMGLAAIANVKPGAASIRRRVFEASDLEARKGTGELTEEIGPTLGAVCDQGLVANHNEDAFAVGSGTADGEPWHVVVVCDGVSSASFSNVASSLAAKAARDSLVRFAATGDLRAGITMAMTRAIQEAHAAACSIKERQEGKDAPGTTLVACFVYHHRLTVGWSGDSRAYWVTSHAAEAITKDHSWASEAVERGEMSEAEAMVNPLAHAITRCIGPLEATSPDAELGAGVRTRDLAGPGQVLLCSDGLWNYLANADELSAILRAAAGQPPIERARILVAHALSCGGRDNVTVVVTDV